MTRIHFVKKARKETKTDTGETVKVGESYYWWQFRFQPKHISKTQPKPSQTTQSEYLQTLYGIQERIEGLSAEDIEDGCLSDIISDLETLRDEQEEKKSNMPDQLQESSSGELLQERYDTLDNAISELESIEFEGLSEDDAKQTIEDDDEDYECPKCQGTGTVSVPTSPAGSPPDDTTKDVGCPYCEETGNVKFAKLSKEKQDELIEEKLDERRQEILEEIQNVSLEG